MSDLPSRNGLRRLSRSPDRGQRGGDRRSLWFLALGVGLMLVATLTACRGLLPRTIQPEATESVHLLLGNPSDAVPNATAENNFLIVRSQYALSYSRDRATANWAAWHLDAGWLGERDRPPFMPDTSLPAGWYQVTTDDYTGSGFNRGHLVPAADRNRTQADSAAVFLMTNIMPQSPDNNQGPWVALEIYCRDLARQGKHLHIIAGTAGVGGEGERGRRDTIGRGRITVPEYTWKLVVVRDRPLRSSTDLSADDRIIAILLPNIQGIRDRDWREFRRSVDQLEQITGYDFLADVPDDLEATLEARVDEL